MGIRQVVRHGGQWYMACAAGLLVLNDALEEQRRVYDRRWAGSHAFVPCGDGMHYWRDAAMTDEVLLVDLDGNIKQTINLTQSTELQRALGLQPQEPADIHYARLSMKEVITGREAKQYDQLHINWIQLVGDEMYVTSARRRCLIRVLPTPELTLLDNTLWDPHDFTFVGDWLVCNDSRRGSVAIYDKATLTLRHRIPIPFPAPARPSLYSQSGWMRGLAVLDDNHVLCGGTPLSLTLIKLDSGTIQRQLILSGETDDSCHGLCWVTNEK
jgi:hypothetical protein